jgi:hypothetical protein
LYPFVKKKKKNILFLVKMVASRVIYICVLSFFFKLDSKSFTGSKTELKCTFRLRGVEMNSDYGILHEPLWSGYPNPELGYCVAGEPM